MLLLLVLSMCCFHMFFAVGVLCMPAPLQGPHITQGWGQVVRLRHLYAARQGVHLLISFDGQIQVSEDQTLCSLMEICPVGPGCVVIRGVATNRFLCMEGDGRLYSSTTYSRDNCTFREQILPDGYNIYFSDRHEVLLSLGNHRQRLQDRDRGVPALAQFLPRISTLQQASPPGPDVPEQPGQSLDLTEEPVDTMDAFGKLSQIIHSPSFHKR
ncbi:fibroblast growth factor 19 [Tautogolabrus adspersus]